MAEWTAGLDVGGPGEGVDAELLDGLGCCIATADEDSADGCWEASGAGDEFAEKIAESDAEEGSVGWSGWRSEGGVEDGIPPRAEGLRGGFEDVREG